jgi:hypothetical protein
MQMFRQELPAGDGQLIVVYANEDTASQIEPVNMTNELALDAARLLEQGWRLLSVASIPMRQTGTAGNVLFQSGGQYVTQVALIATYSRLP